MTAAWTTPEELAAARETIAASIEGWKRPAAYAVGLTSATSSAEFEFPVIAHLRDTQVYVHCARDGASVFDLPRSRGEQDWEQWKPLTRWITRHTSKG